MIPTIWTPSQILEAYERREAELDTQIAYFAERGPARVYRLVVRLAAKEKRQNAMRMIYLAQLGAVTREHPVIV